MCHPPPWEPWQDFESEGRGCDPLPGHLHRVGKRRQLKVEAPRRLFFTGYKPVYDAATKQRTLVRMRRPIRHCPTCKRTEEEFHQRGKHSHLYKTKDLIEQMKAHVPEVRRGY